MSMKRMVSYVCYAVAALALLAVAFLQLPQQADVGLALLFAMAFGAGNTNRVLAKWAQDSEYQKHVMDERNLAIKEKAGNITNMFTTTLLGIAIVVFLCMGYVFPAVVLGGVVVAQLVSLIFVSSLLEKKMWNIGGSACAIVPGLILVKTFGDVYPAAACQQVVILGQHMVRAHFPISKLSPVLFPAHQQPSFLLSLIRQRLQKK